MARKRKMTPAQRRAALKNLAKARRALRAKRGGRVVRRRTTKRKAVGTKRRSALALHRIRVRAGRKGAKVRKFKRTLHAMSDEDYISASHSNPFRKGKVRKTTRRIGTIFKRKGRRYIVTRLRNGVKVARPWASRVRK